MSACLSEDAALALVAGRLAGDAHTTAIAHVDGCVACQRLVAELARDAPAETEQAKVGRYTLEHVLGAGAMGVVYAAHDPELDRRVALKLLRGDFMGSDAAVLTERLIGEAKALAKLAHANVVPVFEVGRHDGEPFLVMELVDGQTLASWLRRPRAAEAVLAMFAQAGAGLAAAHSLGIVHRDFKPDNVLVGRDGRARVTDFGLASATPGDAAVDTDGRLERPLLTRHGALVGTPAYMSPEQLAGAAATPASDQFAFAVAVWEAFAGARPFTGATFAELRADMERGAPSGAHRVPRRVRAVLARAFALEPAARWPELSALLAALERAGRPRVRPREAMVAAVAVSALAVTAGALWRVRATAAPEHGCTSAGELIADAWSPRQRDSVRAAFAAAGSVAGAGSIDAVVRSLDAFAATWIRERDATCRATHVDHSLVAADASERLACLDTAHSAAAEVVGWLEHPEPAVIEHALEAVQALPAPAACARVRADAGMSSTTAREMQRRLALVHAAGAAGYMRRALDEATALEREAEHAEAPALRAAAAVERATWTFKVVGVDAARPALVDALRLAIASGAPGPLADAATEDGLVASVAGTRTEAALALSLARGAIDRLGGDPWREAGLAEIACVFDGGGVDPEAAHARCTDARSRVLAVGGPDDVRLLELDIELASNDFRVGHYDAALAEFRAAEEGYRRLYREHPAIDTAADDEAWTLTALGRPREAIETLERVIAHQPTWTDPLVSLGRARGAAGDIDQAVEAYQRAIEVGGRQGERASQVEAWVGIGELRLGAHRIDDAARAFDAAAAITDVSPAATIRARLAFGRAQVAAARGDRPGADLAAKAAETAITNDASADARALAADLARWRQGR